MNRCTVHRQRSLRADDREVRIRLEVFVAPHPSVHVSAGRALMVLLQELQDDRIPVRLVQVALSGQL